MYIQMTLQSTIFGSSSVKGDTWQRSRHITRLLSKGGDIKAVLCAHANNVDGTPLCHKIMLSNEDCAASWSFCFCISVKRFNYWCSAFAGLFTI